MSQNKKEASNNKQSCSGMNINRGLILIIFLLALVLCGLTLTHQAKKIDTLKTQMQAQQQQISSLQQTLTSFQTATTQQIDTVAQEVNTHDRLISELERMFHNR